MPHSLHLPNSKPSIRLALTVILALGSLAGCHSDKMSGGNTQTNGNGNQANGSGGGSQQGGANAGGSQKGGGGQSSGGSGKSGGTSSQLAEPSESTTGVPSGPVAAASDDGSPRAVGHTSTAMPGAPQGTLNGKQQQDKSLDSPETPSKPRIQPQ